MIGIQEVAWHPIRSSMSILSVTLQHFIRLRSNWRYWEFSRRLLHAVANHVLYHWATAVPLIGSIPGVSSSTSSFQTHGATLDGQVMVLLAQCWSNLTTAGIFPSLDVSGSAARHVPEMDWIREFMRERHVLSVPLGPWALYWRGFNFFGKCLTGFGCHMKLFTVSCFCSSGNIVLK